MKLLYLEILKFKNNKMNIKRFLSECSSTNKNCLKNEKTIFVLLFIVLVGVIIILFIIFCIYKIIINLCYNISNSNNTSNENTIDNNNNISNNSVNNSDIKNNKSDSNYENEILIKKYYLFQNELKWVFYNDKLKKFGEKCTICLENFDKKKSKVCLTPCNHIFHFSCLRNYIFISGDVFCPNCKFDFFSIFNNKNIDYNSFQVKEELLFDSVDNINNINNNNVENINNSDEKKV